MNTLKRMFKNPWVITGAVLMLIFPMIINFSLLTWKTDATKGPIEAWIGFFASYYGAIFGGVISGAITLVGVLEGFKKSDIDRFDSTYYDRKAVIFEEINKLKEIFINIQHYPATVQLTEYKTNRDVLFNVTQVVKKYFNTHYRLFHIMMSVYDGVLDRYQFSVPEDSASRLHEIAMNMLKALEKIDKELDEKYEEIHRK